MADDTTTGIGIITDAQDPGTNPGAGGVPERRYEGRFTLPEGRNLRAHTARGVIVNSAFSIGMIALNLVQRLAVAAFLTVQEFGFWGLLVTTLLTLAFLKEVGISDKYIQQDEEDQVAAFQKAFTLEFYWSAIFYVLCAAALPVYANIYGRWDIIVPGLILCLNLFASAFGAPMWVLYRRMDFKRQRTLQAISPVCGTIATVGLAVAGAGYWSLVIGQLAGTVVGALVALRISPYPVRFLYEKGTLREYFHFSWPLFIDGLTGLLVVQGAVIVGNFTVGLVGIGAIGLATNFAQFTSKVDGVIKQTLYPAVCAVNRRSDLLREIFVKSNRLAMMWGLPFGVSLYLFGPDLVTYVLGAKWRIAENLLQVGGLMLGLGQVAFNWTLFMRAINNTKPIAWAGIMSVVVFFGVTMPLMIVDGLNGYIIGMAFNGTTQILFRGYYMQHIFKGFNFATHLLRALAPSIPAVGAVYAMRALESGPRHFGLAVAEVAVYWAVTLLATWAFERNLLAEVTGYLRGKRRLPGAARALATG
jgi:PST family polysaccharide transporter